MSAPRLEFAYWTGVPAFTKVLPQVQVIVPVTTILPVAHHARLEITKLLELLVVKFVGYTSVIVKSPVSGPLFPYVIVY